MEEPLGCDSIPELGVAKEQAAARKDELEGQTEVQRRSFQSPGLGSLKKPVRVCEPSFGTKRTSNAALS